MSTAKSFDMEESPHIELKKNTTRNKKGAWEEFVSSSTLHGLHFIFEKKRVRFLRVLWLLIILGMISLFIWQASMLVSSYLQFKVTSKVQIVFNRELVFPAVTICNENMYRKSVINNTDYEEILEKENPLSGSKIEINWALYNVSEINMTEQIFAAAHKLLYDNKTKTGMLYSCKWREEKCTSKNFTEVMTEMGLCYTFNSGKTREPIVVQSTGDRHSLKLILSVDQEEYNGKLTYSAGLRCSIHDQNEPPPVKDYGFAVSPGSHVYVAISKSRIVSLPFPYETKCEDKKIPGLKRYTKFGCYQYCKEKFVISRCSCRAFYMTDKRYPFCNISSYIDCAKKATVQFYEGAMQNCNCTEPCDRTFYRTSLSYGQFPSISSANAYKDYDNPEKLRRNTLAIDLYFESLEVHTIEQVPVHDMESLFGEFGGLFGLFLGASFISLFEIADFLIRFILSWFRRGS